MVRQNNPEPIRGMSDASLIGLISDTHSLLRPKALAALQGSELILHAGDVGSMNIIEQLRELAPVVAIKGNIDKGACASELPSTAIVQARSALIYVLHDIQQLGIDPAAANFNIVISGHSHRAARTEQRGVLYINPGSAGPRRFRLPITVARLSLAQWPWTVEFIELPD